MLQVMKTLHVADTLKQEASMCWDKAMLQHIYTHTVSTHGHTHKAVQNTRSRVRVFCTACAAHTAGSFVNLL